MNPDHQIKILLIENNPGDALLVRIHLSECASNFELEQVESLHRAIEILEKNYTPDIILLDLSLPDAEGLTGLRNLHSMRDEIPIIMLTGLNDEATAMRALRLGAQDYLVKGMIDARILSRGIKYAIERKAHETERDRLQDELLRSERLAAMGQTVGGVMHCIKNVLTRMVSSERLIEKMFEENNTQRIREVWPILRRATDDLNHYVKGMLNISREETLDAELNSLNEVAEHVYKLCSEDAERLGIELNLELDPAMPQTIFSQHLIADAALNLVTNAMEAASDGARPHVKIQTRFLSDAQRVELQVRDNGQGIPESLREHIFDPFFSNKGVPGVGLGLAMAQKSVLAHHGRIDVERNEDETVFQINLPMERPHLEATA